MTVSGSTARRGTIVVWYPGSAKPAVSVDGARLARVRGGWIVTAPVEGDYTVTLRRP